MGLGGGKGVPLPLPAATFPVSTLSLRAQDGTSPAKEAYSSTIS